MRSSSPGVLLALVLLAGAVFAQADPPLGHKDFLPSPAHPVGWRGDGSGVFPGATPVTEWDGATGKNILWKVDMPSQTMASPIVVGDRVITLADPQTILCYDVATGKRLWYNAQDQLDLLYAPDEAKQYRHLWDLYHRYCTSHRVAKGTDPAQAEAAKAELAAAGVPLPAPTYNGNGALNNNPADFNPFFTKMGLWANPKPGIAATLATPVSDGKYVWAWYTSNTAACYDLQDGKTVWMKFFGEIKSAPRGYLFPSPALADGVLVIQGVDVLRGLKATTGDLLWEIPYQPGSEYACGSPLVMTVEGKKVVVTWRGWVVSPTDGTVLMRGWPAKAPDGTALRFDARGNSAFPINADTQVVPSFRYGPYYVFHLKGDGAGAVQAEFLATGKPAAYDHDDGTSCAFGGYLYMNNGWDLIEEKTGTVISRQLNMPAGGYPGCSVAGSHLYNFDGAASCGVAALGPDGQVVAVNHLYNVYAKKSYIVPIGTKIGNRSMGDTKTRTAAYWQGVEEQLAQGVIGWIGRRHECALGEMTGDPFFQGDRIYVRTYAHLICIGPQ